MNDTMKFGDLVVHVTDDGYRVDAVEERFPHWFIHEWDLIADKKACKRQVAQCDIEKAYELAFRLSESISSFLWDGVIAMQIGQCVFKHNWSRGSRFHFDLVAPNWSQRLNDIVSIACTIAGLSLWDSHGCHSGWMFRLSYQDCEPEMQTS